MTDAQTLTRALGGRWHGRYGLAFCPAHDNRHTPALSLADGSDGRLLAYCFAGCSFPAIAEALRRRGLGNRPLFIDQTFPADEAVRRAAERAEAEKRTAQARRVWQEARPIAGTLGESYLRGRGITCDLPPTLRFHPECWHGATANRLPAMLALVEAADGFAVHRTWLGADGRKAGVEPAKAMLGPCAGGAVRLSETDGPLVVAEGIETALSLLCGLLRDPATVWAALSTSGVKALHLPPQPGHLTIAPDGDDPGCEAAYALAERATALGWQVSLLPAPQGRDWNDVLRGRGEA